MSGGNGRGLGNIGPKMGGNRPDGMAISGVIIIKDDFKYRLPVFTDEHRSL